MTIRDYFPEDYQMISGWCCKRDMSPPPEWSIPSTGVIVPDVACGFILCMNNQCGVMDFFMTNPEVDKKTRKGAIDAIVEELELSAKEAGIRMLFANSKIKSIQEAAIRTGYELMGSFLSFKKEL